MLGVKVEFRKKDNITFRLGRRNALSRAASPRMSTEYTQIGYEDVKRKMVGLHDICGS